MTNTMPPVRAGRRPLRLTAIVGVLAAAIGAFGTVAVEKAVSTPALAAGVRAVWPLDTGETGAAGAVVAVDFAGGGTLTASVHNMATGSFRLAFSMQVGDRTHSYFPVQITTTTGIVQILYSPSIDFSVFYDAANGSITTGTGFPAPRDTGWHRWQITVRQDGAHLDIDVSADGSSIGTDKGSTPATLGKVTEITLGPPLFDRSKYVSTFLLSDVGLTSP